MADLDKLKGSKRSGDNGGEESGESAPTRRIQPSTRKRAAERPVVAIRVDDDVHQALRVYAFTHDTSIQAIGEKLLLNFLRDNA